jgi:hypothetical protein
MNTYLEIGQSPSRSTRHPREFSLAQPQVPQTLLLGLVLELLEDRRNRLPSFRTMRRELGMEEVLSGEHVVLVGQLSPPVVSLQRDVSNREKH